MAWSSEVALNNDALARVPTRAAATVRVLLVSQKINMIETLCELIQQLAVHVEVCRTVEQARKKLCRSKYEGIIVHVDDDPASFDLLKSIRQLSSHLHTVSYAIVTNPDCRKAALRVGANFVLDSSSPTALLMRTLKVSYSLLVREKRRYHRHPLQIPVSAKTGSQVYEGESLNISEGGIAFLCAQTPRVGEQLLMKFQLPGTPEILTFTGEVCWNNLQGAAGVEFRSVPVKSRDSLNRWLAIRMSELLPLHIGSSSEVLKNCQSPNRPQPHNGQIV